MQAHICKELGLNTIYLSSMHLTQRVITGYDVLYTHDRLMDLNPQEREKVQVELHNKLKYNTGMYMYRTMKKVRENVCIFTPHQFG